MGRTPWKTPVSDAGPGGDASTKDTESDGRIRFETLKPLFDRVWPGFGVIRNLDARTALSFNMQDAGRPRPLGHDAHHIVPWADARWPEADAARKILENFKIHLSDEANGVWLPGKPGISPAQYHKSIALKGYYKAVAEELGKATKKEDAIRILKDIGQKLSAGKYP